MYLLLNILYLHIRRNRFNNFFFLWLAMGIVDPQRSVYICLRYIPTYGWFTIENSHLEIFFILANMVFFIEISSRDVKTFKIFT